MTTATNQALALIERYRNNPIIMKFVKTEAIEKTASDIRARTGSGTTAKAVELLMITNSVVADRVNDYITSGLIGCVMAANVRLGGE